MRSLAVPLSLLFLLTALTACGGEGRPAPVPAGLDAGNQALGAFPEPQVLYPAGVNTPTPAPAGSFYGISGVAVEVTTGSYDGVEITRAQFGDAWPFTVESGVAECEDRNRMPLLRVGKDKYPLTGRLVYALADPYEVWRDDPNNPGDKMSLEPIVQIALTQCDPEGLSGPSSVWCLAARTGIDTPNGYITVADLRVGMEVWTVDASGARIAAVIHKVANNAAPEGHHMVDVVLDDGRRLLASPGHPLADGRTLQELVPGDRVDGAQVMSVERVSYEGETYDILPAGGTGRYWANGILLGSTIVSPLGCGSDNFEAMKTPA